MPLYPAPEESRFYGQEDKLIGELEKLGVLNEITGGKRKKIYVFEKYLKLFY